MNRAAKSTCFLRTQVIIVQFERTLESAVARLPMRVLAYCLMPTHFHLLLWPRHDGDVSRFVKWLTTTHAKRWNESHGTVGRGAVYQSRFRCVCVETDEHLLRAWSYIERNPLNADLVVRAEDWRWCSLMAAYTRAASASTLRRSRAVANRMGGLAKRARSLLRTIRGSRKVGSDPGTGTGVRPQRTNELLPDG